MLRIMPIAIFMFFGVACSLSVRPDFNSQLPQDRLAAIREARQTGNVSAVGPLIELLSSDDPLVRLASIDTLHDLTGKDFGYDPSAPRMERERAASRWAQWYMTGQAPPDPEAE